MSHKHLLQASVADLHPTQFTVGGAWVVLKRAQWAHLDKASRLNHLLDHCFPAVKGPGGRHYIVDHHHLGMALLEEAVPNVWVMQMDDFSELEVDEFWRTMEFRRWTHPYDHTGKRREYADIPTHLGQLTDDPYRSLAGFVRKAGGFSKDITPFSEFFWADYYRARIPHADLKAADSHELKASAIERAMALADERSARHLPGWAGMEPHKFVGPSLADEDDVAE